MKGNKKSIIIINNENNSDDIIVYSIGVLSLLIISFTKKKKSNKKNKKYKKRNYSFVTKENITDHKSSSNDDEYVVKRNTLMGSKFLYKFLKKIAIDLLNKQISKNKNINEIKNSLLGQNKISSIFDNLFYSVKKKISRTIDSEGTFNDIVIDIKLLDNILKIGKESQNDNELMTLLTSMVLISVTKNTFGFEKIFDLFYDNKLDKYKSNNMNLGELLEPISRFSALTKVENSSKEIVLTLVMVAGLTFLPKNDINNIFGIWSNIKKN